MLRSSFVILLLTASTSYAQPHGTTVPICPDKSAPDCVISNWGQVDPDGLTGMVAPRSDEPMVSAPSSRGARMTVGILPVAANANPSLRSGTAVKAVVSPVGLFPKETAALTSAVEHARFNRDGSIASGESAIAEAAAAAARKAAGKYALTLYVKVSQRLKPEESTVLDAKVRSINAVLARTLGSTSNGEPKS